MTDKLKYEFELPMDVQDGDFLMLIVRPLEGEELPELLPPEGWTRMGSGPYVASFIKDIKIDKVLEQNE